MRISDMNWMQVEQQLQRDQRAVLPVGSTEQHAYLSLSVDAILAERVAIEAAEPLGVPVYPVLAYGIAPYFRAYPGTVSLQDETHRRVIAEILDCLAGDGFRRILILNGHGGNTPDASFLGNWMQSHPGVAVKWHDWWKAARTAAAVEAVDPDGSHASWVENFPWTRLTDVVLPEGRKPMADRSGLREIAPAEVRDRLGDGNFGGDYAKPDEQMLTIWRTGVAEAREAIEGPWT